MGKVKLEYIWLDGYMPEPTLRSKTKLLDSESFFGSITSFDDANSLLGKVPEWNFDGSSTMQAEGRKSDCILKPVRVYQDRARKDPYLNTQAFLVLCEVYNPDGTPHESNTRHLIENDSAEIWFGFEQEYTFVGMNGRPLGFPEGGFPYPQGPYYCSVGSFTTAGHTFMRAHGRGIVEEHLNQCVAAGLDITGINAEVLVGQWEFQCFGKGPKKASDDLQIARYLLHRIVEEYGIGIELGVKPVLGDWNGSGCHTNFSNKRMREEGGEDYFNAIYKAFEKNHKEHIAVYGSGNAARLTGHHETASIDVFKVGASDRGASIRITVPVQQTGKGYLEDRRPGSNMDPYKVTARVIKTLAEADALID